MRQSNGDLAFVPDPAGGPTQVGVGFSASGVELYARYWMKKFALVGGFDDYIPRDLNPLIHPDFKTRYGIFGGKYHYSPSGCVFFEARVGDTTSAVGKSNFNAGAIGIRYDFSLKTPHVQ